jgi:hypothetical protein
MEKSKNENKSSSKIEYYPSKIIKIMLSSLSSEETDDVPVIYMSGKVICSINIKGGRCP